MQCNNHKCLIKKHKCLGCCSRKCSWFKKCSAWSVSPTPTSWPAAAKAVGVRSKVEPLERGFEIDTKLHFDRVFLTLLGKFLVCPSWLSHLWLKDYYWLVLLKVDWCDPGWWRCQLKSSWCVCWKNTLTLAFWQLRSWQQLQLLLWQKLWALGSTVVKH